MCPPREARQHNESLQPVGLSRRRSRGIEDPLLLEEALAPEAVVEETGHRVQRSEGFRLLLRPRVAGDDDELQRERSSVLRC
jgi:hypothetical protein